MKKLNEIMEAVIGCAIEAHRQLDRGLWRPALLTSVLPLIRFFARREEKQIPRYARDDCHSERSIAKRRICFWLRPADRAVSQCRRG